MKNKRKKIFDTVLMTREIRDAMYGQKTDPKFDPSELQRIKEKWTKLLNQQEKVSILDSKVS